MSSFDIIIQNGHLVEGSGNPWFLADVGVKDGKILKIGTLKNADVSKVIDASGLIVCPGFIDIHTHSEAVLLVNPSADSHIRQGITTDVIGNCGFAMTPVCDYNRERYKPILDAYNVPWDWETFEEYLETYEKRGVAINVVPLSGHGAIRATVMGAEERPPTAQELTHMKELVAQEMAGGAFGISTGLFYAPSGNASTNELIELMKVIKRYNGIYSTHIRSEGDHIIKAVKEAIEIGEKSGVPVQISHFKAIGPENWKKVKEGLKLLEAARERRVDVTCDVYAWMAGVTPLIDYLPHWAHEGGIEKIVTRLKDPKIRETLQREMQEGVPGEESLVKEVGWDQIIISQAPSHPEYHGKKITEVAAVNGMDPFDLAFDLIIEDKAQVRMIEFWGIEEEVVRVLTHPLAMLGSDGSAITPKGYLGAGNPHPRYYGNVPNFLGEFIREKKIMPLGEGIRKATLFPAQRLGLKDRGLLKEGMWADVVVFDATKIRAIGTYTDPHHFPEGIKWVLVNGVIAIEDEKYTGALAGKVLRKQA